jgi:hypothetical protein
MPTYEMTGLDGNTYQIEGPDGLDAAAVSAEILKRAPQAGVAAQETPAAPTSPPAPVAAAPKPAPEPAAPSFFEQAALNQVNAAEIERGNPLIKGGQAGVYGISGMPSSYAREQAYR